MSVIIIIINHSYSQTIHPYIQLIWLDLIYFIYSFDLIYLIYSLPI